MAEYCLVRLDGRLRSRSEDVVARSETLESWLSTTEVRFATVLNAVECTFEIKLTEGLFKGNITVGIVDKARKLNIDKAIVIHDSILDGVVRSDESGVIKLRRSVITICLERTVVFQIINVAAGVCAE